MAAREIYDYVSNLAADYTTTELSIKPTFPSIVEEAEKNQTAYEGPDGSEEVVTRSNTSVWYIINQYNNLTPADAGTITDFYHDTTKGNGRSRTFYLQHGTDGHTYTVRFTEKLRRKINVEGKHSITARFKVMGYKPDTNALLDTTGTPIEDTRGVPMADTR